MTLSPEQEKLIAGLANQVLEALARLEVRANELIEASRHSAAGGNTMAVPPNRMVPATAADPINTLASIRTRNLSDLLHFRDEPFVARVVAEDQEGNPTVFYFSRATPPTGLALGSDGKLGSYRAPLGRLAELSPGDDIEIRIPKGEVSYTVRERILLRPRREAALWDAIDDRVETGGIRVTVDSLRRLLARLEEVGEPEDMVAALLAESQARADIHEGFRRRIISRMQLRDQPILDKFQGEIFRLPLNRRLILSGPPGTGKTTTLIRRLAQKRNIDDLSVEERELIAEERVKEFFNGENWMMFTPTELLKLYLKEAFAKEGIPASETHVRTWTDTRRRLAREVFRVLRSERGGRFMLDEDASVLADVSGNRVAALFDEFSTEFRRAVVERYAETLSALDNIDDQELASVVQRIQRRFAGSAQFDQLFDMTDFHGDLSTHVQRLSAFAQDVYKRSLNLLLREQHDLLDQLASYLETLETQDDEDDADDDGQESAEVVTSGATRETRMLAYDAYRRAVGAKARALHEGRSIAKASRSQKILDWLGGRVPDDDTLRSLGATLWKLRQVRYLANTHRNLIGQVPSVFQRFRRAAHKDGRWYRSDAKETIEKGRVEGLEVDLMLLLMLGNAHQFLARQAGGAAAHEVLRDVQAEYVTQVLVDEATDFSPVQLACMLELAHPEFRSFFASGDVRQRVTAYGVRSLDDLRWVAGDIEIQAVSIGYRQSKRLTALGLAIAALGEDGAPELHTPDFGDEADIPPLLGENLIEADLARWLSNRIREVERAVGQVPSIAIFVDGDDRIDPLVATLRPLLADDNLDVVGCKEGRVVGSEDRIRIFDIQFIKGLEFEAVFFVGVDALAQRLPDLFDKFLFVGTSRAATYLGISCEGILPLALEALRTQFETGGWS